MAVAAGIANYSNEIEHHRIAILFLGLAGFYRDFCSIAWEEDDSPISLLNNGLDLNEFILGQLVGPDPGIEEEDALNHLVSASRPEVVRLLIQIVGSVDQLFVSPWRTEPGTANEDGDDSDRVLADDEILNDATPEKLAAYSWLDSGADVVLDRY
jgi:hypothetical protein